MKFFVDTADIKDIRELQTGLLDGVTTNPSLIHKAGRKFLEVVRRSAGSSTARSRPKWSRLDMTEMMREAEILRKIADNIAVKVPLTVDGLKACKTTDRGRHDGQRTLCFSANQALLAAKAGATFISPFVGRLDDIGYRRHGADPRHPADLRQLRFRDRDPGRLRAQPDPRPGGRQDRRRRDDRAAGA